MDSPTSLAPLSTGSIFEGAGVATKTCPAHGPYTATLFAFDGVPVASPCPICEAEAERKTVADRTARPTKPSTTEPDGLPPRFAGATLENWRARTEKMVSVLRIATAFAASFDGHLQDGRSLIFSGNPGTGKTHLACAIARKIRADGYTARIVKAADFFFDIKSTWTRDARLDERSALRSFVVPALLVVDEVGQSFGSEVERMLFFRLVNARYEAMRPTILVTNAGRAELAALGEPTLDRFKEGGGGILFFPWESYRK